MLTISTKRRIRSIRKEKRSMGLMAVIFGPLITGGSYLLLTLNLGSACGLLFFLTGLLAGIFVLGLGIEQFYNLREAVKEEAIRPLGDPGNRKRFREAFNEAVHRFGEVKGLPRGDAILFRWYAAETINNSGIRNFLSLSPGKLRSVTRDPERLRKLITEQLEILWPPFQADRG